MTAIAHALQKAGLNTDESRLRMIATDALAKHHGNVERAITTFEKAVAGDSGLIREALRFYLHHFKLPGADQVRDDHQRNVVNARQPNGDGRDHRANENQEKVGASSSRGGVGLWKNEHPAERARPVREPSPADRAAANTVAKVVALTVLDTFRVRDGRSIGDVRYGELGRLMTTNAREAAVIKLILDHGNAPHDARVRDIIKIKDFQVMIQRAAEVVDAA